MVALVQFDLDTHIYLVTSMVSRVLFQYNLLEYFERMVDSKELDGRLLTIKTLTVLF